MRQKSLAALSCIYGVGRADHKWDKYAKGMVFWGEKGTKKKSKKKEGSLWRGDIQSGNEQYLKVPQKNDL